MGVSRGYPNDSGIMQVYVGRTVLVAALLVAQRAYPTYKLSLATALAGALVLVISTLIVDELRGDYFSTVAVVMGMTVGTAALVPWGGAVQFLFVVLAALGCGLSHVMLGGDFSGLLLRPVAVTLAAAVVASVYLAFRLDRHYSGLNDALRAAVRSEDKQLGYGRLLGAMRRAELRFLDERNAPLSFSDLLSSVLELTGSAVGLIAEVSDGATVRPFLRCHAVEGLRQTEPSSEKSPLTGSPMEIHDPNSLAVSVLLARQPVCHNELMTDLRMAEPSVEHLPLTSFLGLPVYMGEELVGVIAIANRSGGYDKETIEYLRPLLTTSAHLLNALREQRRRDKAEQEVLRLNANLEQRVVQRTAALQAALREIEGFSYTVSHDLRSPLRAMYAYSAMLLEDYGDRLDETARGYLTRLENGAVKMGHLIDDVLSLARVSQHEIRRQQVDLSGMALAVIDELRTGDPERTVDVRIEPGIDGEGDPTLVLVVLQNLLGNAWKFTAKREEATIRMGRSRENGQAYYVRDDGAGFSMAHAANLFKPFQRLHDDSEFEGSGIGLATVRRIIERHDGRVWAESEPEEGATFYFTLGSAQVAEGQRAESSS